MDILLTVEADTALWTKTISPFQGLQDRWFTFTHRIPSCVNIGRPFGAGSKRKSLKYGSDNST